MSIFINFFLKVFAFFSASIVFVLILLFLVNFSKNNFNEKNLSLLNSKLEIKLISKLIDFKELVKKTLITHEPQMLSNYLHDLAALFHKYYANNRILNENKELLNARLVLVFAIQIVIKNGLTILGISKPDRM